MRETQAGSDAGAAHRRLDRRPVARFRVAVLLLVAAGAGCDPTRALAPQSASIEIVVDGVPTDGIASVTAFVQDTAPPRNRSEQNVPVGRRTLFDNLGAGFGIRFGLRNLGTHRCTILDGERDGLSVFDSTGVLETSNETTHTVSFTVRCRSATVDVVVSGLPAGDSAHIRLATGGDTIDGMWFRNGATPVNVVPGNVVIVPDTVDGSDGFAYDAAPQTVTVQSAQTSTAPVDYGTSILNQSVVEVRVGGLPNDTGLTFRTYIRSQAAPFASDSATVTMGGSHTFPNHPAGVQYEVLLTGLAAHRCRTRVNGVWTFVGDTISTTVTTTRDPLPDAATFDLLCHTGALDVTIAGLPSGDSARIDFDGVFSIAQLHAPNGTSRLYFAPYPIAVMPLPVAGSDGLTYTAAADTIQTVSRQTATVTVQYAAQQPAQPGSISGRVTGNGFGISGATVTLTGDADTTDTTGNNGSYAFGNLSPGTYTLSVTTPFPGISFSPPSVTVTLQSGEDLTVNFAGTY